MWKFKFCESTTLNTLSLIFLENHPFERFQCFARASDAVSELVYLNPTRNDLENLENLEMLYD